MIKSFIINQERLVEGCEQVNRFNYIAFEKGLTIDGILDKCLLVKY